VQREGRERCESQNGFEREELNKKEGQREKIRKTHDVPRQDLKEKQKKRRRKKKRRSQILVEE